MSSGKSGFGDLLADFPKGSGHGKSQEQSLPGFARGAGSTRQEGSCRPDHERRCACCDACPRCVSGQLCGVCGGAFHGPNIVRQVELRFATWDEIDWEERMWLIPAERRNGGDCGGSIWFRCRGRPLLCWRRCGASMGRSLTSLRGRGGGDARSSERYSPVRAPINGVCRGDDRAWIPQHGIHLAQRNGLALGCYRTPARAR